jgi:galactofuranosylgalactofuranosylrhamnosyl-N-acetylglucosaminyl-diphospho-decaprenol beta-1,5/1,6-galactofuranosyltransferase
MRKVYREALPVLASKQKWEEVLLPSLDGSAAPAAANT